MLYGVGLGPGSPDLLTLKAIRVIREVNEVIVPGDISYSIVSEFRNPRLVRFPMGRGEEIAVKLSKELSIRCMDEDIAFACMGDPAFFSTFQLVAEKVLELNPDIRIEMVPGIPSFTSVFSRMNMFVRNSLLLTVPGERDVKYTVMLKCTKPGIALEEMRMLGMNEMYLAEKIFMDDEKISEIGERPPEKTGYLSLLVGVRR